MVYCGHCAKNVAGERIDDGYLCCGSCGRVLEDFYFAEEPSFVKNAAGQSKLAGNYVRTVQHEFSAARQRTLDRAYDEMKYISFGLGVNDESMADQALTFYKIALDRNFTRGRKSEQVQAACLYIAFRHNNKPYLLIDFSNYLRTNVYVLGAVFLQLCEVLRLGEHPIVQKPIDPSLFIHKYTNNLIKHGGSKLVSDTALSIVASMKRDWMQTGRKPSGLCGAALYISALAHGFKCSKPDILRIVHVCEATLTKRLVEFENTESSSLTIDELNTMAKEHEKNPIVMPNGEFRDCTSKDLLCEHKDNGVPYFALGLCEACYKDFDKLSGGLGGGLDPPAFQRAERERMKKTSEEIVNETCDSEASNGLFERHREDLPADVPECIGADVEHRATKDGEYDESYNEEESENFSDIDDQEVDGYLHNEEEKHFKKIIWEKVNREYLEEQAAVAKSRKEMKQRRAHEAKNSGPAQSAAEATLQMLRTKRLSSKVNYDRLGELFNEPADVNNFKKPKKVQFDLPLGDTNLQSKVEDKNDDEKGLVDEFEDEGEGDMGEMYENAWNTENMNGNYFPEDHGYNYNDDDY
ncbi:transcription factor IIIB 90 kDa subunit isoform X2 [Abrus precatorius]|uniref:Transcription factor IIIB 90 kDa subunit isoform X2 n=1 Tax=Abrus precatorius TaxID=3816 RepID=A0A8B8LF24_ABRPR|nr:transcription factor IIIB 90 kDa subunit isoform X2 [Abrus precatorius]